ncbi:hypothetical protein TNCV_4739691 [Trichonephila clavipes]|nr:hypothetical protein TNCV_4739691 [Trichonephila clavipes]
MIAYQQHFLKLYSTQELLGMVLVVLDICQRRMWHLRASISLSILHADWRSFRRLLYLSGQGNPENTFQTLHSQIPRWRHVKSSQKTLTVRSTVYEKNEWCSRPTTGVPLALATMNFVGLVLTTSDRQINSHTSKIKVDVQSVHLSYRDTLEHAMEWISAHVVAEWSPPKYSGLGSRVVKVLDHGRHVMSTSPVPLKTRRVRQRCTLNLSRAQTSSRWCGRVVRRGGASLGVVHVT